MSMCASTQTVEGHWEVCASLYATTFPKPPADAIGRLTVTGQSLLKARALATQALLYLIQNLALCHT